LGDLKSGPATIDDFILMKADGYPTYNFCHIIDDYLMRISHVIRSQEFISSVPKYLNLHEALDLRAPKMATLPYVMAIDGRRKLSKRDGAKDILDYAKAGYLPEAMLNFLATLGWNDGTEQEIFSKAELISKFNLSRVQKAAARFDERRLLWMNGHWLRHLSLDQLFERAMTFWPAAADNFDASYKKQVLSLAQDRLKTLSELEALTGFFFEEPKANPELLSGNPKLSHLDKPLLIGLLQSAHQRLSGCSFYTDDLPNALNQLLSETGQTPAVLFSLIRIATTWAPASPGLSESLKLLGKERSLNRLQQAIDLLSEVSPVSS
jgi:glutamyl-tRNA synthetase